MSIEYMEWARGRREGEKQGGNEGEILMKKQTPQMGRCDGRDWPECCDFPTFLWFFKSHLELGFIWPITGGGII